MPIAFVYERHRVQPENECESCHHSSITLCILCCVTFLKILVCDDDMWGRVGGGGGRCQGGARGAAGAARQRGSEWEANSSLLALARYKLKYALSETIRVGGRALEPRLTLRICNFFASVSY